MNDEEEGKSMKKILLIGLAVGGFAFVPAQRSDAQPAILVPRPGGLSFGFPGGYTAYPTYLNYYPYGYYRHPYVHYYPYSYSYYRASSHNGQSAHRNYRRHHRHYQYNQ
jgi:hypothetical protein